MNHRKSFRTLNRDAGHRRATLKSMVTALLRHERIRTTRAKALEVRRRAEKMITRAKLDSVHNRRIVRRQIEDKAVLAKLFTDVGPRFTSRAGGYTRILKLGQRSGDAAEMVLLGARGAQDVGKAETLQENDPGRNRPGCRGRRKEVEGHFAKARQSASGRRPGRAFFCSPATGRCVDGPCVTNGRLCPAVRAGRRALSDSAGDVR